MPSILEGTHVLDKCLGIFVDYRVFSFWFHYFCREFADSMAPGGILPPCPQIAVTAKAYIRDNGIFYCSFACGMLFLAYFVMVQNFMQNFSGKSLHTNCLTKIEYSKFSNLSPEICILLNFHMGLIQEKCKTCSCSWPLSTKNYFFLATNHDIICKHVIFR